MRRDPRFRPHKETLPYHFDVFKAGQDEIFQQLAADTARSDHQHPAGGDRVGELFPERSVQFHLHALFKLYSVLARELRRCDSAADGTAVSYPYCVSPASLSSDWLTDHHDEEIPDWTVSFFKKLFIFFLFFFYIYSFLNIMVNLLLT